MDPVQLREKARQFRRLALVSIDGRAIEALTSLAEEFETAAEIAGQSRVLEPQKSTEK